MSDLLNTKQAAEYCHMNPRNITEAVKDGRLHYVKQDNHKQYWFSRDEVERFQATRPDYVKNKKAVKATAAYSPVVALSELNVDPELEELIAPLSTAEFQQLTDSCTAEGIRDPILVWNDTIVDGHNRYRIAQTLGLDSVPVKAMNFASRDDAKRWIVQNQLGRRNVTPYERCRLALLTKASVAAAATQRMLAGKVDPTQISAQGTTGETRDTLAKMAGVSHDTLHKVEVLESEADDDMKAKLRAGNISVNKAWNILYPKKPKTITQPTTTLDTSAESTDTFSAQTSLPVDNDITPTASDVAPPEQQAPVSSQQSADDVSDSETSRENTIDCLTNVAQNLASTLSLHMLNNDYYCYIDEAFLEKEWSHNFTLIVYENVSQVLWQKFQKARETHSLNRVVIISPTTDQNFTTLLPEAVFAFTAEGVEGFYRIMMFDFTAQASVTT